MAYPYALPAPNPVELGPDYGKVAVAANMMGQLQDRRNMQQILSGGGSMENIAENLVRGGYPNEAVKAMAVSQAMNKNDPELQAKQASTMKTNIENYEKLIGLLEANPEYYPQVSEKFRQAGIPVKHFSEFITPDKKFDYEGYQQYIQSAKRALMSEKDKLGLLKNPYEVKEGDNIVTYQDNPLLGTREKLGTAGRWNPAEGQATKADLDYQAIVKKEELGQTLTPEEQAAKTAYEKRRAAGTALTQPDKPFPEWTDDEKKTSYDEWMYFDKRPSFATRDAKSKSAWEQGKKDYMAEAGITMGDIAVARNDIKGEGASLLQQKKIRGSMGSFVRNIDKQVDRVDEIGKDLVSRFGTRALDLPFRELKRAFMGSGAENVLEAYTTEISAEIGKLSTGSSASVRELSTEAQERWGKIHDPNLSLGELKKVLDETKHMAKLRLESADEEIGATRERLRSAGGKPVATTSTTGKYTSPEAVRDAYKTGKISRDEAKKILQQEFNLK